MSTYRWLHVVFAAADSRFNGDLLRVTDDVIIAARNLPAATFDSIQNYFTTVLGDTRTLFPDFSVPPSSIQRIDDMYPLHNLSNGSMMSGLKWRYIWSLYRLVYGFSFVPDDAEFDVAFFCDIPYSKVLAAIAPNILSASVVQYVVHATPRCLTTPVIPSVVDEVKLVNDPSAPIAVSNGSARFNLTCRSLKIATVDTHSESPHASVCIAAILNKLSVATFMIDISASHVSTTPGNVVQVITNQSDSTLYITPLSTPIVDLLDATGSIRISMSVDPSIYLIANTQSVLIKLVFFSNDIR